MANIAESFYFSKGSEKNIKITTVEDIEIFKALLSAKMILLLEKLLIQKLEKFII